MMPPIVHRNILTERACGHEEVPAYNENKILKSTKLKGMRLLAFIL